MNIRFDYYQYDRIEFLWPPLNYTDLYWILDTKSGWETFVFSREPVNIKW